MTHHDSQCAALYIRSSKDRKDVSPDAQRRALQAMAMMRGLTIVEEFVDVVISGKDENRAEFQRMVRAVRNARRGWSNILIHDTSRLSRKRITSLIFEEMECGTRGVRVIYKTLPDADPLTEMLLRSLMQAMDEYHSLISKQKGLAGMAENVHAGFRAGGQAPTGYRLKTSGTGAMREGVAVTKSTLDVDPDVAPEVARYLAARAGGIARKRAKRDAGSTVAALADSTLIGIEWNALTYAGHTVWNVHAERGAEGYVGGTKRRPRSEWVIRRDTHVALIDEEQAETLLQRLTRRADGRRGNAGMTIARESSALLGGKLYAPDGTKWWSEADRYRHGRKGEGQRSISKAAIERPVIDRILEDVASPAFAGQLLAATRRTMTAAADPAALRRLRDQVATLAVRIGRTLDMAADLQNPAPALRKVEELEQARVAALEALQQAEADASTHKALASISTADVAAALAVIAQQAHEGDRGVLRSTIVSVLERVELDPVTLEAAIFYRFEAPVAGVDVASPRGFEPRCPP